MSPELHRPVAVDRIGPNGLEVTVQATDAECAALAARMRVPAVLSLRCWFRLSRCGMEGIEALGELSVRVVQTCVASLDDFETVVEEGFAIRFVPAGQESDVMDPEAEDEIPFGDGVLDLGEAAAEQLGLALDPYPRKPDAELPALDEDAPPHPFAALEARRRGN